MNPIPPRRWIGFLVIVLLGVAADLLTKAWLFSWPELRGGQVWWMWQKYAGFQLSLNEGALFGFGKGGVFIFAAISVVAVIGIPVWLFVFKAARDRWLTFTMAFISAGILGNLYDRLGFHGLDIGMLDPTRLGEPAYAVRDWILFQWSDDLRWPNFNIADAFLVCGAISLLIHGLFIAEPCCKESEPGSTDCRSEQTSPTE